MKINWIADVSQNWSSLSFAPYYFFDFPLHKTGQVHITTYSITLCSHYSLLRDLKKNIYLPLVHVPHILVGYKGPQQKVCREPQLWADKHHNPADSVSVIATFYMAVCVCSSRDPLDLKTHLKQFESSFMSSHVLLTQYIHYKSVTRNCVEKKNTCLSMSWTYSKTTYKNHSHDKTVISTCSSFTTSLSYSVRFGFWILIPLIPLKNFKQKNVAEWKKKSLL